MSFIRLMSIILLTLSNSVWALTTQEAFKKFYNDEKISSNHCGVNTQLFIQYLKEKNVDYKDGFVVSIHEDFAALNHFDARWGSTSRYEDGETFQRSNWYFHVFAVVDGIAYDFSQAGMKTQPLQEYLETSYIPKKRTENIFFLGRIDREKALAKYLNMDFKIYDLDSYALKMGPVKYEGTFIELFENNIKETSTFDLSLIPEQLVYSSITEQDGVYTITNPKMIVENKEIGLLAYEKKICQAFGFMGALPTNTELSITDKEPALYLYTSMRADDPLSFDPQLNSRFSHQMKETMGSVERNYFHHAAKVSCSHLSSLIKR